MAHETLSSLTHLKVVNREPKCEVTDDDQQKAGQESVSHVVAELILELYLYLWPQTQKRNLLDHGHMNEVKKHRVQINNAKNIEKSRNISIFWRDRQVKPTWSYPKAAPSRMCNGPRRSLHAVLE